MANHRVLGRQTISAATLASATSLTVPAGTERAWVQACDAPIRFTLDGETTPTSTVGHVLASDAAPLEITTQMGLRDAKFILESSSPTLEVTYFGPG